MKLRFRFAALFRICNPKTICPGFVIPASNRIANPQQFGSGLQIPKSAMVLIFSILLSSCSNKEIIEVYFENSSQIKERYTINRSTSRKEGVYFAFFPSGKTMIEGSYADGLEEGVWMHFEENGDTNEIFIYAEGKRQGSYKSFVFGKYIVMRGHFKDDQFDGLWQYYYPDGTLSATRTYLGGSEHGISQYFNKSSEITAQYHYDHGRLTNYNHFAKTHLNHGDFQNGTGHINYYSENDTLIRREYYSDGLLNGLYEEFYDNGQLKETGYFDCGKKVGRWKVFSEYGIIQKKLLYNPKGVLIDADAD